MKKRSLALGFSLLIAGLPLVSVNAQTVEEGDSFYIASNIVSQPVENVALNAVPADEDEDDATFRMVEEPGILMLYLADDVMTLSYVNDDREKVFFAINDEDGNMLFSRYFKDEPMVHSRVVLSKLPAGEYSAVLRTDKDLYRKSFAIKE